MAQALINDPEIVFLDEPMSGLDPLGRYQIREIILSLKAQGKTIFFNSHVLSDVEKICDRVAILARGELLCIGSLQELLGDAELYQVKIQGGKLLARTSQRQPQRLHCQPGINGSAPDRHEPGSSQPGRFLRPATSRSRHLHQPVAPLSSG
jgi:ABC-type multidrug transport system ATPase subunit